MSFRQDDRGGTGNGASGGGMSLHPWIPIPCRPVRPFRAGRFRFADDGYIELQWLWRPLWSMSFPFGKKGGAKDDGSLGLKAHPRNTVRAAGTGAQASMAYA